MCPHVLYISYTLNSFTETLVQFRKSTVYLLHVRKGWRAGVIICMCPSCLCKWTQWAQVLIPYVLLVGVNCTSPCCVSVHVQLVACICTSVHVPTQEVHVLWALSKQHSLCWNAIILYLCSMSRSPECNCGVCYLCGWSLVKLLPPDHMCLYIEWMLHVQCTDFRPCLRWK